MTRIFEKSAGGIVYRKRGDLIEVLLLQWKNAKGQLMYVIPKGHIETSEKAKETALREISEETGLPLLDLEIIKFMNKINFSFKAKYLAGSPIIDKDVYLFLVRYNGTVDPIPQEEEGFLGYAWFTIPELKNIETKPDIYGFVRKNIQFM